MTKAIALRDVSVAYGEIVALRNVFLHVGQGELVALLGANGAGKTTVLKAIMGLVGASTGSVTVNGTDMAQAARHDAAWHGIAFVPEGRRIFKRMTVRENLDIGGVTQPSRERRGLMDGIFELFPRLAERQRQLGGTLSGGEQQMLAIGRALMARPDFILFDEPSLGLAPLVVETVFEAIGRIAQARGIGGILVEQNVTLALGLATRGYVLASGAVVLSGSADALNDSPRLQEAYLGMLAAEGRAGGASEIAERRS